MADLLQALHLKGDEGEGIGDEKENERGELQGDGELQPMSAPLIEHGRGNADTWPHGCGLHIAGFQHQVAVRTGQKPFRCRGYAVGGCDL